MQRVVEKYIANIITGSRIIFSLPLLFIPLSSAWFYVFYLFCGFTDMIDGTIARKTGAVSKLGAKLDTIADFVFMLVCSIKILPLIRIALWLWGWIIIIASIKIFNIALVFIRKKKLISIHSVFNKIRLYNKCWGMRKISQHFFIERHKKRNIKRNLMLVIGFL